MSTRIDRVQGARVPRVIRIRSAAAIALALLAMGLAIGLVVGRLQAGSDQRAASASVTSAAPSTAKVPVLTYRDDYATRHLTPAKPPVLTYRDDYATRHLGEQP